MRRFVIGTAGHVDHGKTALVRALTGVETDRLPEEKRRGISIELGFADWDLGSGDRASIIDVPGHRRFVHAMIAGATGIELVLLVVAADEGVMPQTREHVAVCELLGVRRAVIAVTKADLVDDDLARVAEEEARALLPREWHSDAVVCSAVTGRGLDAMRDLVRAALSAIEPRRASAGPARLAVDRVFSVRGAGTVVTGTLVQGQLRVDQPLVLASRKGNASTSARGLQVHDAKVGEVDAPTRVAVNLSGASAADVRRGDVLTGDVLAARTSRIDVGLERLRLDVTTPLRRGVSLTLYVGTARTAARVDAIDAATAIDATDAIDPTTASDTTKAMTGAVRVRLRLSEALVIFGGDRIVLRGSISGAAAGAVAGGGVVLDAHPPRRSRLAARRPVLDALEAGDAALTVRALVAECAPRPLPRDGLVGRFALDGASLAFAAERLIKKSAELMAVGEHGFLARSTLAELAAKARELVAEHHRRAPLDRGLPLQTLREKLGAIAGPFAAEDAIRRGRAPGTDAIVIDGDVARIASFAGELDSSRTRALEAAARVVRDAGARGASEFAVREAAGASVAEARAILAKLAREKSIVALGDLWFEAGIVDAMRSRAISVLAAKKRLTVIEWKELSGLARKQAILLLEHFDRLGITRRDGDSRVLV